jgi:hypothetical protein
VGLRIFESVHDISANKQTYSSLVPVSVSDFQTPNCNSHGYCSTLLRLRYRGENRGHDDDDDNDIYSNTTISTDTHFYFFRFDTNNTHNANINTNTTPALNLFGGTRGLPWNRKSGSTDYAPFRLFEPARFSVVWNPERF